MASPSTGSRHARGAGREEKRNLLRPALRLENLGRSVNGTALVTGVTVTVEPRQVVAIVGPSGSGKSSLLRLLNRLDEPTSSLDAQTERDVEELICDITRAQALTCLIVTHDIVQARRLASHALVVEGGRMVDFGPIEQVLDVWPS